MKEELKRELKEDGENALMRVAGLQLGKAGQALMAGLLEPNDEHKEVRTKLAKFFGETKLGRALIQGMMGGTGVMTLPDDQTRLLQLAHELLTQAMLGGADEVADLLMGPLRQVICDYLADNPEAQKAIAALPVGNNNVKVNVPVAVPVAVGAGK